MLMQLPEDAISNISANTILVGGYEWGCSPQNGSSFSPIYRRVLNIQQVGNTSSELSVWNITTNQSSFLDCFKKSSISFTTQQLVSPQEWLNQLNNNPNSPSYGGQDPANITAEFNFNYNPETGKANESIQIYSDEYLTVTCTNCYVVLKAGLEFDLETSWDWFYPTVDFFETILFGDWMYNLDVEVDAHAAYANAQSLTVTTIDLPEIMFCIGWVPIYIDPEVPINAGYTFTIDAQALLTAGLDFEGSVDFGVQYNDDEGWSPVGGEKINKHLHKPTFKDELNANLNVYVAPDFEFLLYGIGGPFINVVPGIDFSLAYPVSDCTDNANVTVAFDFGVDVGAEIVYPDPLSSGDLSLFNGTWPLWSDCNSTDTFVPISIN